MRKYRLALLGCGFLNEIVASEVGDNKSLDQFELVGVLGNREFKAKEFAQRHEIKYCQTIEELMALKPDFVAEAASVDSVKQYAESILSGNSSFVVLSIGAFADEVFYLQVERWAQTTNQKVYIASGAVGGFDILRATSLMSPVTAKMRGQKSQRSLMNTPLAINDVEEVKETMTVFEGTTAEAIKILPTHVNVAIATALASAGVHQTNMKIEVVPDFVGDDYKIEVAGEQVKVELNIYSKTSAIAAWSVIATLRNAVASIVF